MLKKLTLHNLLSFGPDPVGLEMRPVNVLIGPNGSGKSNLIDAISLLQAMPTDIMVPIREGGGIQEWLYKGVEKPVAKLEATVEEESEQRPLCHHVSFVDRGYRAEIVEERVEGGHRKLTPDPFCFYHFKNGEVLEHSWGQATLVIQGQVQTSQSALAQSTVPHGAAIAFLRDKYRQIRIYRDWTVGRSSPARKASRADDWNGYVMPDGRNLGMIISRFRSDGALMRRIIEIINDLIPGVVDIDILAVEGYVPYHFKEGAFRIPASRLSDGTLRFLTLVLALLDPEPPPLMCIEEPELGLHPDMIVTVTDLLREASERTQLVITTHSTLLVDAFSDDPEAVVVCERADKGTTMRRLEKPKLEKWLKEYSLGRLWEDNEIGGNRW
jgi:predicted ATPase